MTVSLKKHFVPPILVDSGGAMRMEKSIPPDLSGLGHIRIFTGVSPTAPTSPD